MSGIDALLMSGRAAHEGLMVDTCTITRPGAPILDRATSVLVPGPGQMLYAGKCRVKAQRMPRTEVAGEELAVVARYELALPFGAAAQVPAVADVVEVTASADARLVGQRLRVLTTDFGSTVTAWRMTVEAVA